MTDESAALETFSASLDAVVGAIVEGIASAQTAIDRSSLTAQQAIEADPQLAGMDLQAPWYQLAHTNVELKLAFSVSESPQGAAPATAAATTAVTGVLTNKPALRLLAQPVSAAYQNHFNFNAQAASSVTLSLAPVPSPQPPSSTASAPQLSAEHVQGLVLQSDAGFATKRGPKGARVPVESQRFGMQYNPLARMWFVHQFSSADPSQATVAAVDDVTEEVRVIRRRS